MALGCGGEEPAESTEHEHAVDEGAFQPLSNARVTFENLEDGATVSGPLVDGKVSVHVEMGVEGAEIKPAGELEAGTGHHHIIVDGQGVALGTPVPADDTHIHFGAGQTETDVMLAPGQHTLTLQLADGAHRSYGPDLTARVSITVEEAAAEEAEGEGEDAVEAEE